MSRLFGVFLFPFFEKPNVAENTEKSACGKVLEVFRIARYIDRVRGSVPHIVMLGDVSVNNDRTLKGGTARKGVCGVGNVLRNNGGGF